MFVKRSVKCECLRSCINNEKLMSVAKAVLLVIIVAAAFLTMTAGAVNALNVPTGNNDLRIRWDNELRFTSQYRVSGQNDAILANPNADDGDRNFDVGFTSNRVDLVTELDLVYKRKHGFRVSGAFWNDETYDDDFDNDSVPTSNFVRNGKQEIGLDYQADDYFRGPYGELLDAFVFTKAQTGDVPIYLKAGRHTVYWGEALLSAFHGVSYGQMPLDLAKATAQPGVSVKEVFRPLGNVSFFSQVSGNLSVAGQAFFEWERSLVPEAGTYFGTSDLSFKGPGAMILGPETIFRHGRDSEPDDTDDWGFKLGWAPNFMDGTFGFYYRNFSDTLPQAIINLDTQTYHYAFPNDIDMLGISYSRQVGSLSMAGEMSYRDNMPLVSEPVVIDDSSLLPQDGETLGTRGKTLHGVVNLMGLLYEAPWWSFWEAGDWNIEFAWSQYLSVDEGEQYFKGRSDYEAFDEVTKDNAVIAANFNPKWMQVYPGVDLTVPLTVSYGLWGTSSVANGGAKEEGSYGIGLTFDIYQRHQVKLNYVDFFGDLEKDPGTGIGTARGATGLLKDRDFIALTVKISI